MATIDSVYQYYMTTYGTTLGTSKYDSHKKSELRDTYNKIVKSNKDSPLYKLNLEDTGMKRFAIDLKEQARSMQNVVSSLSVDSSIEALFYKKIATASNLDAVDIEYVGDENNDEVKTFDIKINSLAKPQVNTGNYLRDNRRDFETGTFTFDLDTSSNSYEFQFVVESGDTNRSIQEKIARLVNTSDVGLTASVLHDDKGRSALELTSKQTGLTKDENYLFRFQSGASWNELNTLGLNQMTQAASNSSFILNDVERSSLSNSFTINKQFDITLKAPTEDTVSIGFKANTDAIADSVQLLLNSYNNFLELGRQYSNGHNTNRLFHEINALSNTVSDELQSVGIIKNDDHTLSLDKDLMAESITSENASDAFATLDKFKNMLSIQAEKVAVNPINYVDKVIVEYKNPSINFSAPYAQSQYAGMILNRYL